MSEAHITTLRARIKDVHDSIAAAAAAGGGADSASAKQQALAEGDCIAGALQSEVAEKAEELTTHELARCQKELTALQSFLQTQRDKLATPFTFKRTAKPAKTPNAAKGTQRPSTTREEEALSSSDPPPQPPQPPTIAKAPSMGGRAIGVEGRPSGRPLFLHQDEIPSNADLQLKDMEDVTVVVAGSVSAVRIQGLKRCKIWCPAVATSVLCYELSDCELQVAARQVRIHDSHGLRLGLATTSSPVIEGVSDAVVAPFAIEFEGLESLHEAAGLAGVRQQPHWKDVLDFNWRQKEPSPHWRLAKDGEVATRRWRVTRRTDDSTIATVNNPPAASTAAAAPTTTAAAAPPTTTQITSEGGGFLCEFDSVID
eukprot:GHVU01222168.1.p1 GENE.GHVU01222168.1~~GHVU01222168.1.p1  ORF type:complete len:370 (-),score=74.73 GHVU01222168.1:156-1265(-)